MEAEFNVKSEIKDKTLIMKTDGYINNTAGEEILNEFLINFNGSLHNVILDLEKTRVVNSFGISFLIDIIEKLSEYNAKLIFTNLDPTIEKTFNTMGIFQFAEKADSVDSVLK